MARSTELVPTDEMRRVEGQIHQCKERITSLKREISAALRERDSYLKGVAHRKIASQIRHAPRRAIATTHAEECARGAALRAEGHGGLRDQLKDTEKTCRKLQRKHAGLVRKQRKQAGKK